jgi:hypothetical protein
VHAHHATGVVEVAVASHEVEIGRRQHRHRHARGGELRTMARVARVRGKSAW